MYIYYKYTIYLFLSNYAVYMYNLNTNNYYFI